jgi:hypothetical protein
MKVQVPYQGTCLIDAKTVVVGTAYYAVIQGSKKRRHS